MTYNWYRIFNMTEFEALGLVSKTYALSLEDLGDKEILVTKGELVSILYEGIFLPINLNSVNPFAFDGHAVYIDADDEVYLGIAVE